MGALRRSMASGTTGGSAAPSSASGYCDRFCAARCRPAGLGSVTMNSANLLSVVICRSAYSYPNCSAMKASRARRFHDHPERVIRTGSPLAISRSIFRTCLLLPSPPVTHSPYSLPFCSSGPVWLSGIEAVGAQVWPGTVQFDLPVGRYAVVIHLIAWEDEEGG